MSSGGSEFVAQRCFAGLAISEPDWDTACEQYLRDQGGASSPAKERP